MYAIPLFPWNLLLFYDSFLIHNICFKFVASECHTWAFQNITNIYHNNETNCNDCDVSIKENPYIQIENDVRSILLILFMQRFSLTTFTYLKEKCLNHMENEHV